MDDFLCAVFFIPEVAVPDDRCRMGSAEVLINFDDLYPSMTWLDNKLKSVTDGKESVLQNIHICGNEIPRGYWVCILMSFTV